MTRTPAAAVAAALAVTTGYGGLCLKFTRTVYGIGPKYASAIDAWHGATHKHPTSSTKDIPKGAPIYFAPHGSPYGHIAIYLGDGKMRTTNSATGRVSTNSVSSWVAYGYDLLGWSEDLNGEHIPGLWRKRYKTYHIKKKTKGKKGKAAYYDRPKTGKKHITRLRKVGHKVKIDTAYDGKKRWLRTKKGDFIKKSKVARGKAPVGRMGKR